MAAKLRHSRKSLLLLGSHPIVREVYMFEKKRESESVYVFSCVNAYFDQTLQVFWMRLGAASQKLNTEINLSAAPGLK